MAQVRALTELPVGNALSLLIHLLRERACGFDGGEERLVDVARVFRRPDNARHLATQRAVLRARVHEHDIPRLGPPTKLACDQHRTPLFDEERICYRVLPPTNQHGRQYQESVPKSGWQGTRRVYHAARVPKATGFRKTLVLMPRTLYLPQEPRYREKATNDAYCYAYRDDHQKHERGVYGVGGDGVEGEGVVGPLHEEVVDPDDNEPGNYGADQALESS